MGPRWESRFEVKPGKWVFVPTQETIELGKIIKTELDHRWKPPGYFYHLKEGGHVAALQSHLGQTSFIHLDIQSFFDSINRTRVTRCLKGLYSYAEAREVANLSTVIFPGTQPPKYVLPYGFVQSPLLASLCLQESALGQYFKRLHGRDCAKVSIYVDDIVISTKNAELSKEILEEVREAADKARFTLNAAKEEGPAPQISAFNIQLSQHSLSVKPERWEKFLQALLESESEHQRKGILGYVSSVNQDQARQLANTLPE